MSILPRDLREAGEALFPRGPVVPGSVPLFPERLLSQFAGQSSAVFQTADGDEYRWCETMIEVGSAGKVWPLLTRPCLAPPEPPIKDADGYYAYLESLPERFLVVDVRRQRLTLVEHGQAVADFAISTAAAGVGGSGLFARDTRAAVAPSESPFEDFFFP